MAAFFSNLRNTVLAGFGLAFVVFLIYLAQAQFNGFIFWPFLVRWLHIGSGVMWIARPASTFGTGTASARSASLRR